MAKVVTLQLLVDETDESAIADGLNEILRPLQRQYQNAACKNQCLIIDYKLADGNGEMYSTTVLAEIDDAIAKDIYAEGDAFRTLDGSFELPNGKTYDLGPESLWLNVHTHGKTAEGVALYVCRDFHGTTVVAYEIGREMDRPIAEMRADFALTGSA